MIPASIILDLLRTYRHAGTPVKEIMAAGALFDFSDNTMRVNLSRLVSKGIVENFKRGYYRLSDHADPVNEFVEAWREGEHRVRKWDGESWLLVHASEAPAAKRAWALDANGFREVSPALWIRPDNLDLGPEQLETRLTSLGLDRDSVIAGNARIDTRWQSAYVTQFDMDRMEATYVNANSELIASMGTLREKPRAQALKESFHLGGAAVHILAKDPLLPDEFINTAPRRELWKTMLAYDKVGRDVWATRHAGAPDVIPTPQLIVSNP